MHSLKKPKEKNGKQNKKSLSNKTFFTAALYTIVPCANMQCTTLGGVSPTIGFFFFWLESPTIGLKTHFFKSLK